MVIGCTLVLFFFRMMRWSTDSTGIHRSFVWSDISQLFLEWDLRTLFSSFGIFFFFPPNGFNPISYTDFTPQSY